MIRLLLSAGLLLAGFTLADCRAASDAPKWKRYSAREGQFSAEWPDRPKYDTKTLNISTGRIRVYTESLASKDRPHLSITFTEYPRSYAQRDPQMLISAVRDGMKADESSELLSDEAIKNSNESTGKYLGREFVYQHGGVHSRTRLFLKGAWLYQVTVTGKPEEVKSKFAEQFLNSFELKK